ELSKRISAYPQMEEDGHVTIKSLMHYGYGKDMAEYICFLLSREYALDCYLDRCARLGITVVTRSNPSYPKSIWDKWGDRRPPVFFAKGDLSLWNSDCVAVVGSRRPSPEGRTFAEDVGELIGLQRHTLVTGGANGIDSVALAGCEKGGGKAVIFVPDQLEGRLDLAEKGHLVVSAEGFDLPFTTPRAHQRNGYIHSLPNVAVVVEPRYGAGGTWQGASENLRKQWSRVLVYDNGSQGANALIEGGGEALRHWSNLFDPPMGQTSIF
ncbi:MAG: DNA-processing protein DprA, partial [Eubacteriales bacterium]